MQSKPPKFDYQYYKGHIIRSDLLLTLQFSGGTCTMCIKYHSGALRHVPIALCDTEEITENVALVRRSYRFEFDVRQLFVSWFL